MKKVLFLIHDLGQGGAEKVLVNLVNNMDYKQFDITVMSLFDVGVNRQFLSPQVKYKSIYKKMFRGNSHLMKIASPSILHKMYIKDEYDIEISYLEGPCARIIAGCPNLKTKLICWIHREMRNHDFLLKGFRSEKECEWVYNRFNQIVCVSGNVKNDFRSVVALKQDPIVLYNTNETDKIQSLSLEVVDDCSFNSTELKMIGVGKLLESKGFDRILRITKSLHDKGYPVSLYILGDGPQYKQLENLISRNHMENYATLLGYKTNPYKYVRQCDLFVCASFAEGFSTAATEALILGVPVCTVEVSGMKEMLGENNEYGIVTINDDEALEVGIESIISDSSILKHYTDMAKVRGNYFSTEETVNSVQEMLLHL